MDSRASSTALDCFFDRMRTAAGSQEHVWGDAVDGELSLKPSEYWARQCYVGCELHPPDRGAAARPGRRRPDHVGQPTTRTRSRAHPYSQRGDARRVRRRAARRGASDARRQRGRASTASTSTPAPDRRPVGPRVDEVATPLAARRSARSRPTKCPALAGLGCQRGTDHRQHRHGRNAMGTHPLRRRVARAAPQPRARGDPRRRRGRRRSSSIYETDPDASPRCCRHRSRPSDEPLVRVDDRDRRHRPRLPGVRRRHVRA